MDGTKDKGRAGVAEYAEILVAVDSHRGFHDEPVDRIAGLDVRIDPDKTGSYGRDSGGVGGVQDAHRKFFNKIDHRLLLQVARGMAGRKRS